MKYIDNGKKRFELAESITCPLRLLELEALVIDSHPFIKLRYGILTILSGYNWDGPTGVSLDSQNAEPSLYHDALYELMQLGLLDRKHRDLADQLLKQMCLRNGMSEFWADEFYNFVHAFGESHTFPDKHPKGQIIEI